MLNGEVRGGGSDEYGDIPAVPRRSTWAAISKCQELRQAVCRAIVDAESAAEKAIGQPDDPCDTAVQAFNIEGAAAIADVSGKRRAWIGLRAPLVEGKAVLLRLAPLGTETRPLTFDGIATIDLGGRGVRELATRDGWLWGIAGSTADSGEPNSGLWRVNEDEVRNGARISSVRFVHDDLPPSAEGLVIDSFSNRALIVIDGDVDKDNKKCAADAQQQMLSLGPSATWGDPEVPLGMRPQVSATSVGDVATVLFDGAVVDLDGDSADRLATQFFTLRLPVHVADDVSVIGFKQDLRGHITKTAGARALLIADLNGVPHTIDLPFGEGPAEEPLSFEIRRSLFAVSERRPKENDPSGFYRITSYDARFLLVAERRSRHDAVTIGLDSLDVRLIRDPPGD